MSKFFIHRPIFAIVISLIIVIGGLLSAVQLPIAMYPQISPPTISVSTTYIGANANVLNETVAQVIEQQVNGVHCFLRTARTRADATSLPQTGRVFKPAKTGGPQAARWLYEGG